MANEDTRPENETPKAAVVAEPVIPEPVSEPAPDLTKPAEPYAAPKRRPIVVPLVLGGVIAAALGFGLAKAVPGGWPVQDMSGLEAEVARQAQEITALRDQLASAAAPDLSPLEQRLSALETAPSGTGDLQAQIDSIRGQLTQGAMAPDIQAVIEQTEAELAKTREQALALQQQAEETARATTVAASLTRIAAALDSGTPYGTALDSLRDAGLDIPQPLAANVDGLPTITALQASFPEAARAGLEASLQADMGASWTERASSFLRTQTGARSLAPRQGNDPDAILSRAEAALADGDLPKALSEIGALPLEGQGAMADWRSEAERRIDADAALATLNTAAGAQ